MKQMKKIVGIMVLACCCILYCKSAYAYFKPEILPDEGKHYVSVMMYKNLKGANTLYFGRLNKDNNDPEKIKFKRALSSNPEVCRLAVEYDRMELASGVLEEKVLCGKLLKRGQTRISYNAWNGNERHRIVFRLYVTEYDNPFEFVKVGNKDFTEIFDENKLLSLLVDSNKCIVGKHIRKNLKGQLNIKMKPGWKLDKVYLYQTNDNEGPYEENLIKNGDMVRLHYDSCPTFYFVLRYPKARLTYNIEFYYGILQDHDSL